MAFPLFGAVALASALPTLLRKRKHIKEPDFFVQNPQELEAMVRQKTQAEYGGMDTQIREALANAGVLSPSSLSDALTRSSISQGQDIASQILNLYQGEYESKRGFDIQKYFGEQEQLQAEKQRDLDLLLGLGSAVGQYYGGRRKKRESPTIEELLAPGGGLNFNPAPDEYSNNYA